MLSNPDVRNWISAIVGVVMVCIIFGADLLHFHQAGATIDVSLIVGAITALGIPVGFATGKRMAITNSTQK